MIASAAARAIPARLSCAADERGCMLGKILGRGSSAAAGLVGYTNTNEQFASVVIPAKARIQTETR
jgi:hypothetical protein